MVARSQDRTALVRLSDELDDVPEGVQTIHLV